MNQKNLILACTLSVLSASTAMAATTGAAYVSKTTASISLAPRGDLLIATTTVNWDTRASDTLAVDWKAPAGGYCKSSQFVIARGNNVTGDVSWAYRTVFHHLDSGKTIACNGRWVASVVNVDTHKVLASAGYTVPAVSPNANASADSAPTTAGS